MGYELDRETIDHILNVLRMGTTTWKGRNECLNRNRRKKFIGTHKNGKDKFLWERQCDGCGEWHEQRKQDLEVDHIVEIGPYNGDLLDMIKRMYCDQSNLQALCHFCHSRKTAVFNATIRFQRKKPSGEELL